MWDKPLVFEEKCQTLYSTHLET